MKKLLLLLIVLPMLAFSQKQDVKIVGVTLLPYPFQSSKDDWSLKFKGDIAADTTAYNNYKELSKSQLFEVYMTYEKKVTLLSVDPVSAYLTYYINDDVEKLKSKTDLISSNTIIKCGTTSSKKTLEQIISVCKELVSR